MKEVNILLRYRFQIAFFLTMLMIFIIFIQDNNVNEMLLRNKHETSSDSTTIYKMTTIWGEIMEQTNPWPEYPRPQLIRQPVDRSWHNLNGIWELKREYVGDINRTVNDRNEPFPYKIVVPFPVESQLSGVTKQWDRIWYRKIIQIPTHWRLADKRIFIHFEAVDWETTIFLNGKRVGQHRGGYDRFSFDITDHIVHREDNILLVHVYDPTNFENIANGKQVQNRFWDASGIWYSPSTGIWQTVWLEVVHKEIYIENIKMIPDIDKLSMDITINVSMKDPTELSNKKYEVDITVYDKYYGNILSTSVEVIRLSSVVTLTFPERKMKLWSPENPHLYSISMILKCYSDVMDSIESYFGMRSISVGIHNHTVDSYPRILLNNKFVFQMGVLDQGYWPDGLYSPPSEAAMLYDLNLIKTLGFNMVRKHIKVESARWYYWCDVLGILVWQDMPSSVVLDDQFWHNLPNSMTISEKNQFETELQNLVLNHINHPSIIVWIVFNEEWSIYDQERITNNIMVLDPGRLVTSNSATFLGDAHGYSHGGHIKDIHSYPPPKGPELDSIPLNGTSNYTLRPIVNGEYGGIFLEIKGHTWDPYYGDFQAKKNNFLVTKSHEELTKKYEEFSDIVFDLYRYHKLSAAVFTQLVDVENELNGFRTYDRKLFKGIYSRIAKANRRLHSNFNSNSIEKT